MNAPQATVLPIYFIADESGSMSNYIETLNESLVETISTLQKQPFAVSKVRLSIIGFGSSARTYMPLTEILEIETVPRFSVNGSTSFSSAFRELQNRLPEDIKKLKDSNYLVNRPCVFFLTDGAPDGDGWEIVHADITDRSYPYRPNVLAFGIGDAVPDTLKRVATNEKFAFIVATTTTTGEAIAEFSIALSKSLINSGLALEQGRPDLVIEKPSGFLEIPSDLI
jgi:uncharacterized protein YegL